MLPQISETKQNKCHRQVETSNTQKFKHLELKVGVIFNFEQRNFRLTLALGGSFCPT